jgi:hypothetical protein
MNRDDKKSPWTTFLLVVLLVALVLLVGAGLVDLLRAWVRWLLIAGLMIAFLAAMGAQINDRLDGVLIDSRFKMSLSRLQIVLWTILVLSAYLTIALPRSLHDALPDSLTLEQAEQCLEGLEDQDSEKANEIKDLITVLKEEDPEKAEERAKAAEEVARKCPQEPLKITFPPELLAAMGISAVSFAGSSLVRSSKKGKKFDIAVVEKKVDEAEAEVKKKKRELLAAIESEEKEKQRDAAKDKVDQAKEKKKQAEEKKKQAEEQLSRAGTEDEKKKAQKALKAAEDELNAAEQALRDAEEALQSAEDLVESSQSNDVTAAVALKRASDEKQEAENRLEDLKKSQKEAEGLLHLNSNAREAAWIDIFRGEEIGNHELIDMAKVQMFFFTIAVVFSYGVMVYGLLQDATAYMNPLGVDLPAFSSSLNALLAISHGGYLAVKNIDHTEVKK